jgi:cytochrome c
MMFQSPRPLVALLAWLLASTAAEAQLRGHGGPVRAVAVSPDGMSAISGSFDTSAIRWSMQKNAADQVLRFHESAVNAVAFIDKERQATGGEDGKIAIWKNGNPAPERTFEGHTAPIVSLTVSPDGNTIASASWDRSIRLWPLKGGEPRTLNGHDQNVNGVAFSRDGKFLASAAYDATVRIWPLEGNGAPVIVTVPTPLNGVAVAPDGEIIAGGANGRVYFIGPDGEKRGDIEVAEMPIISVAVSPDGTLVAAAGIRGSVATALHWGTIQQAALVLLPALEIAPPAREWGRKSVAIEMFHHLVYATAAAWVHDRASRGRFAFPCAGGSRHGTLLSLFFVLVFAAGFMLQSGPLPERRMPSDAGEG